MQLLTDHRKAVKVNSFPYPTGFIKPAILLIGLPGLLTLLFAMHWGIGLTPDGLVYVGSARSLLDGHGLMLAVDGLAVRRAPTETELQEVLALHPQIRLPEGVRYVTR